MQIGTNGWDNLDTVFVERQNDFPGSFEYSSQAPKHDIENILNGWYGRQNFIELFYCLPEIFAPVHEIASRVADANWQLRKDWNDEVDYNNKYFNRLFSKPNPLMSFKQFVYQSVCYELLTGANFEYFNRSSLLGNDYTNIITWLNMPTHMTVIDKKKNVDVYSATELTEFINFYQVGNRKFEVEKVLPIINYDLKCGNQIDGYKSQLCGAHMAIKNLLPVYEARGVIYIKRGALGFLVSRKSDDSGLVSLTKKEKEEAQNEFQNTYGLFSGKHQVGVTASPVDFVKTSMSIQELQPFEETLADAVAIYATLRVPRHLVPSKDRSTFSNADADMKSFYEDVIIPFAQNRAQSWTSYLGIDRRYIYPNYEHIGVLQKNRKDESTVDKTYGDVWLQRWKNGVCSLNEWITATDGTKGTGPIYEKKIFELTPEEMEKVKPIINLKSNETTSKDTGAETESFSN